MRILHIVATLDPAAGGPSEAVRSLISYKDLGYIGEALTFDDPSAPFLKTVDFPVHALGPQTSTFGYSPRIVPWLRANCDRFDGFIVDGLWQYCGLATMRAVGGSKPYAVFPHGMLDPYFKRRYPLKHLKKALYWYPFEYRVLRRAYRVLFTTEAEATLAEQSFALHNWKPLVVPYGVRQPTGDPETDKKAFLELMPELRSKRFLLYLSRIDPKKGCDLLLQAFGQVAQKDPELQLVMAGPDHVNWMPELKSIATSTGIADRVHWPGMLRGAAKWGAFRSAEALVLPSHQENFGIAVAEALACGTPTLLSTEVNIAATVQQDGAGYMEPDTLEGTRRLLDRWLETPAADRERMRRQAPETFRKRYNMRECARVILDMFEAAKAERNR